MEPTTDTATAAAAAAKPKQYLVDKMILEEDEFEYLTKHVKLYIGMPCYAGLIGFGTVQSLIQFHGLALKLGLQYKIQFNPSESLIPRGRNQMAVEALGDGCTHLLFIDADITFAPWTVIRLLLAKRSIVGAIYPLKKLHLDRLASQKVATADEIQKMNDAQQMQLVGQTAINFCVNALIDHDKQSLLLQPDHQGFMEVSYIPTGFMMIDTNVLKHMRDAKPERKFVNDVPGHAEFDSSSNSHYDWFPVGVYENKKANTRRYLSEDWYFCQEAIDIGYKIYADTVSALIHTGVAMFYGSYGESLFGKEFITTMHGNTDDPRGSLASCFSPLYQGSLPSVVPAATVVADPNNAA